MTAAPPHDPVPADAGKRFRSAPPPGEGEAVLPGLPVFGREVVASCLAHFAARAASSVPPLHLVALDATCGNGRDACFLTLSLARHRDRNPSRDTARDTAQDPVSRAASWRWSVLALDVQAAALEAARALFARHNLQEFCRQGERPETPRSGRAKSGPRPPGETHFLLQGHEGLREILARHAAESAGKGGPETMILTVAMYNLGFLPRSDRRIVTRAPSTVSSLSQAAEALAPGGALTVHAYGGHAGGREELEAVADWFAALPHDIWNASRYSLCNKPRNPETLFLAEKARARGK